eukprot:CAMPEP_0113523302 /NCGR_PEP_ID=MMETSP0014_2-20120614/45637_1 /TAXON_ID=2857 /ORGANISM="Nitzschia sp." /LENGTH=1009 /DNA_ID=CAMNT_0000421391 /DNA_START=324 /DNA_END=3353 /DNA_ORIENTATION=+ /assembly_acc=CAM_ASM_000159
MTMMTLTLTLTTTMRMMLGIQQCQSFILPHKVPSSSRTSSFSLSTTSLMMTVTETKEEEDRKKVFFVDDDSDCHYTKTDNSKNKKRSVSKHKGTNNNVVKHHRMQQQQQQQQRNRDDDDSITTTHRSSPTTTKRHFPRQSQPQQQQQQRRRRRQQTERRGGRNYRQGYNNGSTTTSTTGRSFSQQQRWQRAIEIEQQINHALEEVVTSSIAASTATTTTTSTPSVNASSTHSSSSSSSSSLFPHIRECNAALATFGDHGDLFRALRLYFKMRKTSVLLLQQQQQQQSASSKRSIGGTISGTIGDDGDGDSDSDRTSSIADRQTVLPIPTLVTYSTLMSRAISLGKPKVALRLWKIMKKEPRYMMKVADDGDVDLQKQQNVIIPDVKAANILMNAYAKLNDLDSCEQLMRQMQSTDYDMNSNSTTTIMKDGSAETTEVPITDVDIVRDLPPSIRPNLVTYNTLLDACHKTGELDRALYWKERLDQEAEKYKGRRYSRQGAGRRVYYTDSLGPPPRPDARTYTTLIATVAPRARFQRQQLSGGSYDPSLAFRLMEEMKSRRIRPNGLTYSALIDVCGRCRRPDLALQGLRWMLDDERQRSKNSRQDQGQWVESHYDRGNRHQSQYSSLSDSKVGAWTSAINACGKAGRIDTALKLFYVSMPRFGVQPNTVTCGCLIDCLLRYDGDRTAETIEVLRYMKKNNIPPSQVMYTSLMTYASRLADIEQTTKETTSLASTSTLQRAEDNDFGNAKAVNVYTELMSSLLERRPDAITNQKRTQNEDLYQVTLLFQDMKASDVIPDLACYNVLLRSCARAGDIDRAMEVLAEITNDDRDNIEPNDRTWRQVLRCASTARRSDMVMKVWKMALEDAVGQHESFNKLNDQNSGKNLVTSPTKRFSMETLRAFFTALLRCAWNVRKSDLLTSTELYKVMIKCYHASLSRSSYMGMNLVEASAFEHPHIMASFLQAVVTLESLVAETNGYDMSDERLQLRNLAKTILTSYALSSSANLMGMT